MAPVLGSTPESFSSETNEFFESRIRPVLAEHCYECHATRNHKAKAGLVLDSRSGWQVGGERGPALIPGDPDASLLVKAIRYKDTDLQMPPNKKLPAQVIRDLEKWVQLGAPDPREGDTVRIEKEAIDIEAGRTFWSFQPVRSPSPPEVSDIEWPINAIDRFVLASLESKGITPVAEADTYSLIRRTYFILTGLPPTPAAIQTFLERDIDQALPELVDHLLASPEFGERWGRHWLDVARYAESSGGGRSLMFKNAWRFRDYVIDSYNQDKPFDVFVREQIAGDLMPPHSDPETREAHVVGSGFLALGPINYELQDKELLRMEVVDEQIDTVGRAFLGMTLGCARCHDHKFDPIPTEDYYALAGIFRSTQSLVSGNVSGYVEKTLDESGVEAWDRYQTALKDKEAAIKKLGKNKDKEGVKELKKEIAALKGSAPSPPPKAMSVAEFTGEESRDWHVHLRGAIRNLGAKVPRGFITVATPPGLSPQAKPNQDESGRRQLADWLTDPHQPLTARVYVNRLWHHVFGRGLVRTVDNFGQTGELPSHPALLDYLAANFVKEGWSTKALLRKLLTSRVYRLSIAGDPMAASIDPENQLLWRSHRRRLEAESLRDAMLFISGQLQKNAGGLTIEKFSAYDNGYQFGNFNRRSVYAPAFRNATLDIFKVFDFANPNMVEGRRVQTTLPTQALYMMNHPFVMQQAQAAAKKLLHQCDTSVGDRLKSLYLQTVGRPPTSEEQVVAARFLEGLPPENGWSQVIHSLFASVDFRYLN